MNVVLLGTEVSPRAMGANLWFPFLFLCGVPATQAASLPAGLDPPGQIISNVVRAAANQQQHLPAYSVTRRYTVRNDHLATPAVLLVQVNYTPGEGKRFKILEGGDMSGLTRDAVIKLLNDEVANSVADSDPSSVSAEHYFFELAGGDENQHRLRITPKEKTRYVLNGYVCVSRTGNAIIRLEGTTSKRISFWVGRADVIQEFAQIEGYWLPIRTQSTANVRFIGRTELTIEAEDYQLATPGKSGS